MRFISNPLGLFFGLAIVLVNVVATSEQNSELDAELTEFFDDHIKRVANWELYSDSEEAAPHLESSPSVRGPLSQIRASTSGGGLGLLPEQTPNANQVPHQKSPVPSKTPEGKFLCRQCNKGFTTKKILRAHVKTTQAHVPISKRPHQCDRCRMGFHKKDVLDRHQSKCHNPKPKVQKRNTCNVCEKSFCRPQHLERHVKKQGGICTKLPEFVKPYTCDQCSMGYLKQDALERHQAKRHQPKVHMCDVCQKNFTRSTGLKYHINRQGGKCKNGNDQSLSEIP